MLLLKITLTQIAKLCVRVYLCVCVFGEREKEKNQEYS